jgi:hypothetical protein
LTTIRKLKEAGCECFFEKEGIWTFDGKGELLITIMSSLAQEESRSISENVTWGQRKRMSDGKVSLPYKQFLGYQKGEDGLPAIDEDEAEIVRLIYRIFMEGKTYSAIAKHLGNHGIPSPAGKPTWQTATVRSILQNEKFKGYALLQKTYCENFLTKKMVKNDGRIQQFYVEDSHPAIITPDEFDAVQLEIERRSKIGHPLSCSSPFAARLVCGECGGWYGKKIWGSYKNDKSRRREVWRCNDKYNGDHKYTTPHIYEADIMARFLTAVNELLSGRDSVIEDCRLAQRVICDTAAIDAELAELQGEIEVVTELSRKAIYELAHTVKGADKVEKKNATYLDRHRKARQREDELVIAKRQRIGKSKMLDGFIREIDSRPLAVEKFDERLWSAVIDRVTVATDGTMTFLFKNGAEISV